MRRLDVIRDLPEARDRIAGVIGAAEVVDGRRPLTDQLWLDLTQGGRPGSAVVVASDAAGRPVGFAQTSCGNESTIVQLVVDPAHRSQLRSLGLELLRAATDVAAADLGAADGTAAGAAACGGTDVSWWVADPTDAHAEIASALRWRPGRRLLLMRRPLPTGLTVDIETRSFRPGDDDEAWLAVNNRAFAEHGEQGGWDLPTLRQRLVEPWFDPAGFLVHERDGAMAGFCWTKLHHDLDPVEGEIYVVAVDPDFHGLGLGAQLTIAGLASISERGVDVGMLFVDADNTPAVGLYTKLGFTIHRTDVAYVGAIGTDATRTDDE